MKVLIIIPCFNEESNIEKTVNSVVRLGYDYIIVNDGSTDNTLEIIKSRGFRTINLSNNLGIGGAVQAGYRYAFLNGYDIAVQFDGDGQHRAEDIHKLMEPIQHRQCNISIGSRFIENNVGFKSSLPRRIGIRILSGLVNSLSGTKISDITSGFRAVDNSLIEMFAQDYPREYPEPITNLQVAKNENYIIKEVPVIMNGREHGQSSIRGIKSAYYMLNVILQLLIAAWTKGS